MVTAYDNDPRVRSVGPDMWLVGEHLDELTDGDLAPEVRRRGDVFVADLHHPGEPATEHATADEAIRSLIGEPQ
ncbi:hypothetical protein [Paractinoplanes toevensis]|uniref:Uncharacterized protein n=1 Tax=Paractinoplanes toevensis TaxID=571911 RepID=A0A919T4D1_9ACTN|nr:hypothetical protein [Actinoplanes toevensis]GIM88815.1 hypothetical protein Ato02nite_006080 [Actinoplanes toevensis]